MEELFSTYRQSLTQKAGQPQANQAKIGIPKSRDSLEGLPSIIEPPSHSEEARNKLKEKSALKSKYHQPTIQERFADYNTISKNKKLSADHR